MVMASVRKPRCIIIGAGVAGIAAAVEAALGGMEVIMLERHRYLGGRARSFRDEITHDEIDNGQHVMMGCYRYLRQTLRSVGTEELLHPAEPIALAFASSTGKCDRFDPYRLPGIAGLISGLLGLRSFSLGDRVRLLRGSLHVLLRHASPDQTVAQMLQQLRQPLEVIERFWEPLVVATLNAPIECADARLLQAVVRRAFFGGGDSHYVIIPRCGLSRLWEPLPQWLQQYGGEILLGTSAEELLWFDDRVIGVTTSSGQEIRGKTVITAVPPKSLLRLLPVSVRPRFQPIEQFETMPIVSVYLWFDRALDIPPMVGLWGTASQWVFNRDRLVERSVESRKVYPGHLEVTISGARQLAYRPAEEIVSLVLSELEAIFSQVSSAQLLRWRVIKERSATVLLTPKTARFRLSTDSGIAGLYVAGDWTATGLPATLEGAAASGVAAVRAALSSL